MAEQPKQQPRPAPTPKADKPPKRPVEWGLTELDVLEALAGKQVVVMGANSAHWQGALVGYDQFHLALKVESVVLLLNKGQVAYIHAA